MAAVATDAFSVQVRLRNALYLYPIQRRIAELTIILSECSMKDLQALFPLMVEHIFGINPSLGTGWNLLRISRQFNNSDFDAIYRFLHPSGIFFEIIYKLLGDVYLKYEYPVTFLPQRLKQMILDGSVPSFYMDKLQIDPNVRVPTGLILNSFEFYMFHFAYHLINPWQARVDQSVTGGHETVYLHLSDQYLYHFLPVDKSVVLPNVPIHQTMPMQRAPSPQAQPLKTPKLFKTSVVKLGSTSLSPPSVSPHPHAEVWRSETLIQIAIFIWLSVPDYPVKSNPFTNMQSEDVRNFEDSLPKEDHLRVVRNMIKHIHYFSNNIHNDGSAMDELRKVISNQCQKPLYIFLRRHIHHWPLDSSFLLILETYLSFIQPWRYVKYNPGFQGESTTVDHKWFNYIAENLLGYSVIIQEIIPRFERLDLTSPKHAHMLYRVAKVLSQPNLSHLLREIEACLGDINALENNSYLSSSHYGTPKSPGSPYSPTGHNSLSLPLSHRLNAIIRQEIQELEPPNFVYRPLFGDENQKKIFEFILTLQQSLLLVKNLLSSAISDKFLKKSGFLQAVKDFFMLSSSTEDYSVDERQKTVTYLEHSITLLAEAFEITPPVLSNETRGALDHSGASSLNSSSPSQLGCVEPSVLNPREWQKRTKLIRYESNPDLEPIKSTEVTFLVRFFHQVSSRINEMYGNNLNELYHRNDVWGGIARQLLAPPCVYHFFDKSNPGNFAPRVAVNLPPRVSLRPLASHQTLTYLFLLGLFAFIYDYPIIPFYIFILFLYMILIFSRALISPYLRRGNTPSSPEPFVPLDVSFNE